MSYSMSVFEEQPGRWVFKVDEVYQPCHPDKDGNVPMTEEEATYFAQQVLKRMHPEIEIISTAPQVASLPSRSILTVEFLKRMGLDKIGKILQDSEQDKDLKSLVFLVQATGDTINLDDTVLTNGLALLAFKGYLNPDDIERILA